jgi:hypothetical protein
LRRVFGLRAFRGDDAVAMIGLSRQKKFEQA